MGQKRSRDLGGFVKLDFTMLDIDLRYAWHDFQAHYQMQLPQGLTTLLGGSGEGKSTLLQLIGGFILGQGQLDFKGDDMTHLSPYQRPITTLFQSDNLFPQLTVWQNIAIGLQANLRLNKAQAASIEWALEMTQLSSYVHKYPGQLSGGQAQRVALARMLVRRRPILLLDEPFSALDPSLRAEMLQLVAELTHTLQLTTLLVSHYPQEAKLAGGHIALIENGRVATYATVDTLDCAEVGSPLALYLGQGEYQ